MWFRHVGYGFGGVWIELVSSFFRKTRVALVCDQPDYSGQQLERFELHHARQLRQSAVVQPNGQYLFGAELHSHGFDFVGSVVHSLGKYLVGD
jgi:hypothetical protein